MSDIHTIRRLQQLHRQVNDLYADLATATTELARTRELLALTMREVEQVRDETRATTREATEHAVVRDIAHRDRDLRILRNQLRAVRGWLEGHRATFLHPDDVAALLLDLELLDANEPVLDWERRPP